MRYIRKTSRIAWLLGLTALLAACLSAQAEEPQTIERERSLTHAETTNEVAWETDSPQGRRPGLVKALIATTPCDAHVVQLIPPCRDLGNARGRMVAGTQNGAYSLGDYESAKLSAWLGPLDDRRFVYWSPPQTSVRRERNERQEEPFDKRRRDEQTGRNGYQVGP
jgi:hypothetical protein